MTKILGKASPFIWILLLASFMAFAFQGTRGLWEPDEGRYTNVALEMMHTGDYIVPHRHHETLHVTKPPVIYWALSASILSFGKNEWAARLPMALAFIFTVLMVFQFGKIFSSSRPWLPALIYLSSPLPFIAANIITTDTLLAFAETAAVLAFAGYRFNGKSLRYLDSMWALFGLAFMIKGPPGLLPLLAIVAWQWRNGGLNILARPLGILLFFVIGFIWFFLITQQNPELMDYFLHHEVVDRVASGVHNRNSQWYGGFVVYLPTLIIGALPWLILALWGKLKPNSNQRLQPQTTFLLLWITIPLAVFMISRSRLPLYLLPLFVPIAILLAQCFKNAKFNRNHVTWLLLWLIMLVSIKAVSAYLPNKLDSRAFANKLQPLLPTKPKELVFINNKGNYGLDFYLDTEIEKISIANLSGKQALSDTEFDQDLSSEMLEPEPDRYFLVAKKDSLAFEKWLSLHGYTYLSLGSVEKFEVFAISH